MFLFKTVRSGTVFAVELLPGQEAQFGVTNYSELGGLTADLNKISMFAVETVFVGGHFTRATDGSSTSLDWEYRPVWRKDALANLSKNKPTDAEAQYVIDYAYNSPDFGPKVADNWAMLMKGYTLNVAVPVPAAAPATPVAPAGDPADATTNADDAPFVVFNEAPAQADGPVDILVSSKTGKRYPNLVERIIEEFPCPKEGDIKFYIDPKMWRFLVRHVLRGQNVLLLGPTGTGKTELIGHLADAMNQALRIVDMSTVQDAQSAMIGVHRLLHGANGQESVFDYAPFAEYIQEPGLILLDELNRSPKAAQNLLIPCTDNRRYLPMDVAGSHEARMLRVHPGATFFATANMGAEYDGAGSLDRALEDRFFPIEVGYPSDSIETRMLQLRTGVDPKSAKTIVDVAWDIRNQYTNGDLTNFLSVRHTLLTAGLVEDGFNITEALTSVALPLFGNDPGDSEQSKVKTLIMKH